MPAQAPGLGSSPWWTRALTLCPAAAAAPWQQSLSQPSSAGLFLAAVGRVVPHGRKRCLTGADGDSSRGRAPRSPGSAGGEAGWPVAACAVEIQPCRLRWTACWRGRKRLTKE